MDRFIVSARKYRPQQFDTVVGQSHITTTLKNAIRNQQLAHAFLFCGPRGVGKTTCARILAKTINCEAPTPEGEACNSCGSCRSFQEGTSLNYFELDAASNNSVDDIRQLTEQVRFAPQAGRYKVYVIDEVHMLSSQAFNAFLKTLEEPPPYAIFILATTEKHKILPTILSRCQIFDFKRITTGDTAAHLEKICGEESIRADKAALQLIAQKSEGCLRDALSMLDKIVSFSNGELNYAHTLEHLNILDADYYFKLLGLMQQQDLSGMFLLYEEIDRKGFEGDLVLSGLADFFRNLLVCQDPKAAVLLDVVESFKDAYHTHAQQMGPSYLVSALQVIAEAEIHYRAARNKRLHVEMALIKLAYLQQALQLSADPQGLVKKKITEAAVGFRSTPIRRYPGLATDTPLPAASPGARLIIETPPEKKAAPAAAPTAPTESAAVPTATPKLSALNKIRQQFSKASLPADQETEKALALAPLQKAWEQYTELLRTERNPAAQPFAAAQLQLIDDQTFEVVTANNIEQKFIEQERNRLFEFLQQQLLLRTLQFSVTVDEKSAAPAVTQGILSVKEQYQELAKQYPLVQALKERLRLELDY